MGLDAVADGDDDVEVVMVDRPPNLTVSLGLNCQVLLDGCLGTQFALLENILNVQADILFGRLEQFRHRPLGKPDGIAFKPHLDTGDAILRLVQNYLAGWFAGRGWQVFGHGVFSGMWGCQRLSESFRPKISIEARNASKECIFPAP